MNRKPAYFVGALLLIGIGIVLLLQNLGILAGTSELVFGLLFVAGGAVFAAAFVGNRTPNWWAIIPGLVLAAIGILIWAGPNVGSWGGSLVLGAIGLAFLIVYLSNRQFWWAIIPAGIMLTLTILVGLTDLLPGLENGSTFATLFFLGIGLTFLAVYFLPTAERAHEMGHLAGRRHADHRRHCQPDDTFGAELAMGGRADRRRALSDLSRGEAPKS